MVAKPEPSEWLENYHFYEMDWDNYEGLCDWFEWEIPKSFNIAEYFCTRWAEDKHRIALYAEDSSGKQRIYTYYQLDRLSNQLANFFVTNGIEKGDRVGLTSPQKPETLISLFALWKVGAVPVLLSTLFGPDAVEYRLADSGAKGCIGDVENIDAVRATQDNNPGLLSFTLTIDAAPTHGEIDFWDALADQCHEFDTVRTEAEDNALILYTSGTTGDPKGVVHAHRVMLGFLPGFLTILCNNDLREDDLFWTPTEWAWVAFFAIAFPAMFYGKPIFAYAGQFDAKKTLSLIDDYEVTHLLVTPTISRFMMQVEDPTAKWDFNHVRGIWTGGEEPDEHVLDWMNSTFPNCSTHVAYGQTEAVFAGECSSLMDKKRGTLGKAAPGSRVEIVDPESAEPLDRGEVGEIALRYPSNPLAFKEYWNKPKKTKDKVRNGWLLTEDLGTMDSEGYISFISRKDDVIISSGYRIGPEEIEDSLSSHDAVLDTGVIGIPHDRRGEIPKAFVVLVEGQEPSQQMRQELQAHVKDNLAKYKYPRAMEFVDELPRTSTGKVQRFKLREIEGLE